MCLTSSKRLNPAQKLVLVREAGDAVQLFVSARFNIVNALLNVGYWFDFSEGISVKEKRNAKSFT